MLLFPLLTLLSQVSGDALSGGGDQKDEKKCSELGFNTPNLMCSDCETLSRFSLPAELKKECGSCCTADGKKLDETTKYPKAILEVCG